MKDSQKRDICARITGIRRDIFGPRGKSAFAKLLGISPSTYDYYESYRVPPADTLVAMADQSGVDLRWLITGRATAKKARPNQHPLVERAAKLLANRPDAAEALGAFLDILAESSRFIPAAKKEAAPAAGREAWIPVLGRSAAGLPRFWESSEQAEGVTPLMALVNRYAERDDFTTCPAVAETGESRSGDAVQIVTLDEPGDGSVAEFVASASIKSRWHDAFAVRIDGESMAPDIRHGDVIILSPSEPAVDGRAAVVQLAGQIGVTCKVLRRRDEFVHLVPINEHFPPQVFPAESMVWALRVLARIRPG